MTRRIVNGDALGVEALRTYKVPSAKFANHLYCLGTDQYACFVIVTAFRDSSLASALPASLIIDDPIFVVHVASHALPSRVIHCIKPAIMAQVSENPLISSKPSDSGITVLLHPLVLLTASDQITRQKVRGESDPIAGILLGQQDGRQITAEHAFSAGFDKDDKTGKLTFKQPWLQERVQQCK